MEMLELSGEAVVVGSGVGGRCLRVNNQIMHNSVWLMVRE